MLKTFRNAILLYDLAYIFKSFLKNEKVAVHLCVLFMKILLLDVTYV